MSVSRYLMRIYHDQIRIQAEIQDEVAIRVKGNFTQETLRLKEDDFTQETFRLKGDLYK